LIGAWVLAFIPTLRSAQGTGQSTGQGSGQVTIVRSPEISIIRVLGPAVLPRRLADMTVSVPVDNPLTIEKVALGRRLFFETELWNDRSVSCATCHEPRRAFADARPLAAGGVGRGG